MFDGAYYVALGWMAVIWMVICIIATVPAFAKPSRQPSAKTPNPSLHR